MTTITYNKSSIGRTRRETLGNREYIVAPLSMLVPGVLNGSRGPLLYPPELVNKNPAVWNHVPIVVYHPTENGSPVSARDPSVLNKQGVGYVFKSRQNGRAEGWFDVENVKRVDPRVYEALIKNQPMELSTGLFTRNRSAQPGSAWRGKEYKEIVVDFVPDHLAILPDQKGACSLKDGCGMLINKSNTALDKAMLLTNFNPSQPRDNQGRWSGGGSGGSSGGTGHVISREGDKTEVKTEEQFRSLAEGHGHTVKESVHPSGEGTQLVAKDKEGNFRGSFEATDSKKSQSQAKSGASTDSHETVKQMQKPGDTTKLANALTKAEGIAKPKKRPTQNQEGSQFGKPHNTVKEMPNMATNQEIELTEEDRQELIDIIVDNCGECDETTDKETLNELSDLLLSQLAVNTVPPQFMKKAAGKKVVAEEEESDEEEEMEEEEEVPVKNSRASKVTTKKGKVTVNKSSEETTKLDAKTQFLVNYAQRKIQEEKDALIEKLTANVGEKDKEEMIETLNEESIEKLETLVKLLPKVDKSAQVQNTQNSRSSQRSYVGAGGAVPKNQTKQVNNSRKTQEENDPLSGPLEVPTLNYAAIAGYSNGNFIHRNNLGQMSTN